MVSPAYDHVGLEGDGGFELVCEVGGVAVGGFDGFVEGVGVHVVAHGWMLCARSLVS